MTTNVKIFKSTDGGAPLLSGTVGHLLNVFDAVLVNGYGSKTITITRDGTTATASSTAHGFVTGQCLLIAGADQAEYNGEFYITVTGDDAFTFTVANSPATPATGTITAKIAPAGWTKAYSGTNKAAYRTLAGNQMYWRVDDSGTTSARTVAYEAMTGIDAGTNAFPTDIQVSGGLYLPKSNVADTSSRVWIILATDRLVHVFINTSATAGLLCGTSCFGDIKSFAGSDLFGTLLIAQTGASTYTALAAMSGYPTTTTGCYMARAYTQVGGSIAIGKHADAGKLGSLTANIGGSGLAYPNPADGGLYLAPLFLHEAGTVRGTLPGVWAPLHPRPIAHLDTVSGSGDLAGKKFIGLFFENSTSASITSGQALLETSNTWDD